MAKGKERRGLGRGLSALMADVDATGSETSSETSTTQSVPIERLHPNPDQPRVRFTQDQLDELANSIKSKGVLQPLIVRPHPDKPGEFEIVAGERRWRAAQLAQIHELPVILREFDDTEVLEVAIIENIQRSDLNPIEEAAAFRQLMFKFGHTQEKLAEVLGKSRSHIANLMRLLNLPDVIQQHVVAGDLSAGHARALVSAPNPEDLAKTIINKGLNVRETEKLVKSAHPNENRKPAKSSFAPDKDADTKALEGDLSGALGMKVSIDHKTGQENGKVTIEYESLEQLDALCMALSVSAPQ